MRRGERRRGTPRYQSELVAFAVKHARGAMTSGRSVTAAAMELGLNRTTMSTWLSRAEQSAGDTMREVVMCDATVNELPKLRTIEVRTACGHVVRGLSVADAAALLKALA